MMKISVVIPCYGSERTIENVVKECIETLEKRCNSFEIILVNDCSYDDVWEKIIIIKNTYKDVIKGINLTKNFGQHAAIMAGFSKCEGDIVVTLDDDGQTNPKQMWELIDKINEGYDIAIARYEDTKENGFRRFGSSLNRIMATSLVKQPKSIKDTSYRAIKKYVINEVIKYNKPYPYLAGLLFRITQNVVNVPIEHYERKEGDSGYTIKKLVSLTMNGFTAFSVKPLRLATYIGFAFALMGFIYALTIIINKIANPEAVLLGYSSLMSAILLVGGILMILLGMIGEYVGRIYISINNSPQYVIKETI